MKPTTLGAFFLEQCSTHAENTALVFFEEDDHRRAISYTKLGQTARRLAAGLARAGLSPGDRVAIVSDNSPDWIIVYMAVQMCGGLDVCLHPGMDAGTLTGIVKESRASFAFVGPEFLYDLLQQTGARTTIMTWKSDAKRRTLDSLFPARSLLHWKAAGHEKRLTDDPASIVFRKGASAGRPRGVVLTHKSLLANIRQLASVVPTTELESIITPLPFWHSAGRMALHLALEKGTALVLSSPMSFADDLRRNEAHMAVASPDMLRQIHQGVLTGRPGEGIARIVFRRLYLFAYDWMSFLYAFSVARVARFREKDESPLLKILTLCFWAILRVITLPGQLLFGEELRGSVGKKLRIVLTGGSRVTGDVDRFFQSIRVSILEGYWMTEASHAIASRLLSFTGQRTRRVHGTVGPMLPGTELRLLNTLGDDVSRIPGAVGRIQIRGPQIMQGYLHDEDATTEAIDSKGWLRTGDTGRITTTGELHILGRSGD